MPHERPRPGVERLGDRKPDFLWQHPKTGELYLWYMDGTAAKSGAYLSPSRFGDTRWMIAPR